MDRIPPQSDVLHATLPGDGPFDRAWILIALIEAAFGIDEWQGVYERARATDDSVRATAKRRLTQAICDHPQSRALHALRAAAGDAASEIDEGPTPAQKRGAKRRQRMNAERQQAVARVLGDAVLALAVAPHLDPADVGVLTAPILESLRGIDDGMDVTAPPQNVLLFLT
jgi:hypothetical protein